MSRRRAATLLGVLLLLALATPSRLAAQAVPLERFMQHVARLWAEGSADGLAELVPASGRLTLELGSEASGAVQGRHATAALRSLFAKSETVSLRPSRITVSGARQGFGEFHWTFRGRGISGTQTVSVYVGTVLEDGGWRIREIRLLQ